MAPKLLLKHRDAQALTLNHRAYFFGGSPGNSSVAFASQKGRISVCNLGGDVSFHSLRALDGVRAIGVHPTERRFVMADAQGRLSELNFDGQVVKQISPARTIPARSHAEERGYSACWFDCRGAQLWCALRESKDSVVIECRDARSFTLKAQTTIRDRYGESYVSFHPTPDPETIIIWLAGGQDGQCTYWAKLAGQLINLSFEPMLQNVMPPIFSHAGRMLIVDDLGKLHRLTFPAVGLTATMESPLGEDSPFEYVVCYLDDRYALIQVREGRLVVVDDFDMEVRCEVVIEHHEPQPAQHYYPTLKDEWSPCTDIAYFLKAGEMLIAVYGIERPDDTKSWKDGLLCYPMKFIREQLAALIARNATGSLW